MERETPVSDPEIKKTGKQVPSIEEALIAGWEAFLGHYRVFISIMAISLLLSLMNEYVKSRVAYPVYTTTAVLGVIAEILIGMGTIKIALNIIDGKEVAFDDMFSVTHLFFSYLGATILYCLIIAG